MLWRAATVFVATRVVGVLLGAALLVLPGAAGCLGARRLSRIVFVSVLAALLSALSGMAASTAVNVPPGPALVLCAFGFFLASFPWRRRPAPRTFHPPPPVPPR